MIEMERYVVNTYSSSVSFSWSGLMVDNLITQIPTQSFTYCTNWMVCCLPAAVAAGRVAVRLDTVNKLSAAASESE